MGMFQPLPPRAVLYGTVTRAVEVLGSLKRVTAMRWWAPLGLVRKPHRKLGVFGRAHGVSPPPASLTSGREQGPAEQSRMLAFACQREDFSDQAVHLGRTRPSGRGR
jgi:hypothetical protein